jgi:hypothetical protein
MGLPSQHENIAEAVAEKSDGKPIPEIDTRGSREANNAAQKRHDGELLRARLKQASKLYSQAYWRWYDGGKQGSPPRREDF